MTDRKDKMGRLADRASRKQADNDESDENAPEADETETSTSETEGTTETTASDEAAAEETESETADEGSDTPTDPEDTPATDPESESETDAVRHVKDRPSVYMYLPKEYSSELDIACQMINLTYQRETGDKLAKNRYLYPIVTKVGHENADELSFEEIQTLKDEIDAIDAEETET